MIRDELRRLWAEPRVPDPPVRVWRDWVLLAAGVAATVLEAMLTDHLWRDPASLLLGLALSVATLWRRTRPLAAITVPFAGALLLAVTQVLFPRETTDTGWAGAIGLVLVYALWRWGSGRQIELGTVVLLAAAVVSSVAAHAPLGDWIGGFVVLTLAAALGTSVRLLTTSRARELEQVRARERTDLARELHDTVAHHVSAIVVRAQAGRVLAAADPASALTTLEGIEEEGARTLESMRAMVTALRDPGAGAELAPRAGVADLPRLARAPGGGPTVDLDLDGDLGALPPEVDAAVYRVVQESVTNALRHATGATRVAVRVTGEPDRVLVTVRDDGRPPARGSGRGGYGLTGLRERAALLGGTVQAGPCPGGGWLVEAVLPARPLPARPLPARR